ncbi:MAG: hypothetical protein ABIU29_04640 [Chthoniobacterales bacterium]
MGDECRGPGGRHLFTFHKDGVPTTIPVFGDPTFLAKKKAMIGALGAHFSSNPAIKIVWTSVANVNSEDWSVPHNPADIAAWQAVGYTTEKLLDAADKSLTSPGPRFRTNTSPCGRWERQPRPGCERYRAQRRPGREPPGPGA